MKIAFDCKGTLMDGPKKVKDFFRWLQKEGHELTIWSSLYSYANDTGIAMVADGSVDIGEKYSRFDAEAEDMTIFDFAVDDQVKDSWYLAASNFISVQELPENPNEFEEFFNSKVEEMNV
jgi:hypothetical protein